MAGKSLGVLTVDLVAKVGGFVAGMDKAERSSAKWRKQVEQNLKAVGAASAVSAVGAGLASMTASTVNAAKEITQLSSLSNASTTEFQRMAIGAKQMGIEQDKLGDILKDTQDKLGDFAGTGGGELKNFFEQVASQVGVTIKSFKGLSSIQALELFVDTLERAGVSQDKVVNHMESLADESSRLYPLLRNNGEGLKLFADEAERAGAILSKDTIRKANELNAAIFLMDNAVQGTKNKISSALIPVLGDFSKALSDMNSDSALAATFSEDLAISLRAIGKAAVGAVAGIHIAGKGIKGLYELNEASKGDGAWWETFLPPARIYRAWENFDKIKESAGNTAAGLDDLAQGYASFIKKIDGEESNTGGDRIKKIAGFMEEWQKLQEEMRKGGGNAGDISITDATKKQSDAIASQIAALELQAKTLGMTEGQEKLFKLALDGATDSQLAQARAALEVASAYEQQKKVQEDYKQLIADLRTDEEKLTDQMHARLAVLDAMKSITPDERTKVAGRIADAATAPPPQYEGLDAVVGGPFSELLKINDAESELEKWYSTQLDMLDQFRKERADLTATWDAQELEVKQQHEDALAKIEQARQLAQLSAAESIFGDLADITKTFAGEQSGLYKAMFAVQKAAAIAQSMVAIQTGIAMAAANPFPMNLVAMASVAAATASIVGNIAAIGMAHDGIDSVPETGTWLLQKGERVTTAQTSAKLDRTLNAIQAGNIDRSGNSSGGGTTIHQTITVNGDASQQTIQAVRQAANQGAQQALSAIVSDANRNGPIIQTIRKRI